MTRQIMTIVAALAVGSGALALGCNKSEATSEAGDPHAEFTNLSVGDVDKLLADKSCVAVDANNSDTRQKFGVVPGAVLLTSHDQFQPTELPADKSTKLVFYCGGEKCTAAPKAAKVATQAGYSNVNVMRAGIKGWVDAGKSVDKPAS
jgi:rhodanese-related sulfurtransferase